MKYLAYMRTEFLKNLQYRANYWGSIANGIIAILIQQALWRAVYRASSGFSAAGQALTPDLGNIVPATAQMAGAGEIAGIGLGTMLTYAMMGRVVSGFLTIGQGANCGRKVRTGAIVHDLVKPLDIHIQGFFQNLGGALFRLVGVGGPLFAAMVLLGWLQVPPLKTVALFAISLFAGQVTLFATVFLCNLLSFYTKTGVGIDHIYSAVLLLSGVFVPVEFFPQWLKAISLCLPFASVHYVPVGIWSGIIGPGQVLESLSVQGFWTVGMVWMSRFLWERALGHLTIQGG